MTTCPECGEPYYVKPLYNSEFRCMKCRWKFGFAPELDRGTAAIPNEVIPPAAKVRFRVVRDFGKGINPTEAKAYRVETVELLTENEAFKLMEDLDSPYEGRKYENE